MNFNYPEDLAWVILLLPLLSAVVITLFHAARPEAQRADLDRWQSPDPSLPAPFCSRNSS